MKRLFRYSAHLFALVAMFALMLAACGSQSSGGNGSSPVTVNLGYFPNLTHAVALVGVARGTFQRALGPNARLATKTFNAGPAEIEALFAGDIDIGFVGPGPAINGYIKSNGQALRIIAGASSGGVLFVVRPGANISSPQDLSGKKLADPQVGGTQDIALRTYLQQHGLKPADKGGTVQIISTDNATILSLFKQGKIDGAWMPEPWATRMVVEGHGKVFLDERSLWPNGQFTTTNIVVRTAFMNQHPDLVSKFLQADVETVQYIENNTQSALSLVNSQLKQITGKGIADNELTLAFSHLTITYDPLSSTINTQAQRSYTLGYLGSSNPNLSGLYNLGPLNQVLTSKGLATVSGP